MENEVYSFRKRARLIGSLYLVVCLLAAHGGGFVPSKILVPQDATATANNLLSNEFLFRSGILTHLASVIAIAALVLMLYQLFRPVSKPLSRMMVIPVLVQVPIFLILEVFHLGALLILKGGALKSFDILQQQEVAYLLLRLHGYGIAASQLFWGLWLFPFGMLVYRHGSIPRIFAILLFINGLGYVVDGCAFILLQRSQFLQVREFAKFTFLLGLAPIMLWFLIQGITRSRNSDPS